MDRSRAEREKNYREYRLLDLVVKPRDPDLYEYAFLHSHLECFLDHEKREETLRSLSTCLQNKWRSEGWEFSSKNCGSPEDLARRLTDLKTYEEKDVRGDRRNIPAPALAFLDALKQDSAKDLLKEAQTMYSPFLSADMPSVPVPSPGRERKLLVDSHIIWNLSAQTECPLETWQIRRVELMTGFTMIDQNAFAFCINLQTMVIPDTMAQVGNGAFAFCFSLDNILISETCRDRIFPLQRISQGSYIQIGHPAFEHMAWLSPRDIHDHEYMLGHHALTNDSDYLKAPWYIDRIKGQIVHNTYRDPRYGEVPGIIEKIRRHSPVPREMILCPSCFTPYERELRMPSSTCPYCGRSLEEDLSGKAETFTDRFYDLPPESYVREGEDPEKNPEILWKMVLRLLSERACNPAFLMDRQRKGKKTDEGVLAVFSISGDVQGRGSLPAAFPDPGTSLSMVLDRMQRLRPDLPPEKIRRRKKQYGYDAEVFDRVFEKEILPLYAAARKEGWIPGMIDWTYETEGEFRRFSLLVELLPQKKEGKRRLPGGPFGFLTRRERPF